MAGFIARLGEFATKNMTNPSIIGRMMSDTWWTAFRNMTKHAAMPLVGAAGGGTLGAAAGGAMAAYNAYNGGNVDDVALTKTIMAGAWGGAKRGAMIGAGLGLGGTILKGGRAKGLIGGSLGSTFQGWAAKPELGRAALGAIGGSVLGSWGSDDDFFGKGMLYGGIGALAGYKGLPSFKRGIGPQTRGMSFVSDMLSGSNKISQRVGEGVAGWSGRLVGRSDNMGVFWGGVAKDIGTYGGENASSIGKYAGVGALAGGGLLAADFLNPMGAPFTIFNDEEAMAAGDRRNKLAGLGY
jgi:hypothetical protein